MIVKNNLLLQKVVKIKINNLAEKIKRNLVKVLIKVITKLFFGNLVTLYLIHRYSVI
jgi:hypothetical protein